MSTFAIFHRTRGLIEIIEGSAADALRSGTDLTDGPVWLGEKITGNSILGPLNVPGGEEYAPFEVFVIPCAPYERGYVMSIGNRSARAAVN